MDDDDDDDKSRKKKKKKTTTKRKDFFPKIGLAASVKGVEGCGRWTEALAEETRKKKTERKYEQEKREAALDCCWLLPSRWYSHVVHAANPFSKNVVALTPELEKGGCGEPSCCFCQCVGRLRLLAALPRVGKAGGQNGCQVAC